MKPPFGSSGCAHWFEFPGGNCPHSLTVGAAEEWGARTLHGIGEGDMRSLPVPARQWAPWPSRKPSELLDTLPPPPLPPSPHATTSGPVVRLSRSFAQSTLQTSGSRDDQM